MELVSKPVAEAFVKETMIQEIKHNELNELQSLMGEAGKEKGKNTENLLNSYLNPTQEEIYRHKKLFQNIDSGKDNIETSRALLNKLSDDSKFIGEFGEYLAGKNVSRFGEYEHGVKHGNNVIDFGCERIDKVARFNELKVSPEGNSIVIEKTYLPKGNSMALEVKNGISEINSRSHLLEQVKAGADRFDNSYVGINQDVSEVMLNNQAKYIKAIKDINCAGGKVIEILPKKDIQEALIGRMINS